MGLRERLRLEAAIFRSYFAANPMTPEEERKHWRWLALNCAAVLFGWVADRQPIYSLNALWAIFYVAALLWWPRARPPG